MKPHRSIGNSLLAIVIFCSGIASAAPPPPPNLPHGDVSLKYAANRATGGTEVLVNVKDISGPVRNRHTYVIPFENGSWSPNPIELIGAPNNHYDGYSILQYTGSRRVYAFYIRDDKEVYNYDQGRWVSKTTIDDANGQVYTLGNVDSRTGNNVKARDIQAVRNVSRSCNWVYYCQCIETGSSIQLTGSIFVQNLSYNKQVGVRYGVNGVWSNSSTDLFANFLEGTSGYDRNGVPIGVERWYFDGTLANSRNVNAPYVDVAIYYRNLNSSNVYWDNKFEQNYQISVRTRETCSGNCCNSSS